jgi:hypothetical protein
MVWKVRLVVVWPRWLLERSASQGGDDSKHVARGKVEKLPFLETDETTGV